LTSKAVDFAVAQAAYKTLDLNFYDIAKD